MLSMEKLKLTNRILLGLLMLGAGLIKIFFMSASGFASMLEGMGFPMAIVFAWIVIVVEVVAGIMILANYKMNLAVWGPMIILLVAAVTAHAPWSGFPGNVNAFIMDLVLITNYWMWGTMKK